MSLNKTVAAVTAALVVGAAALGVTQLTGSGCGYDVCVGDSWQAKYVAANISQADAVLTVQPGTHTSQTLRRDPTKVGSTHRVVFVVDGVKVQGKLTSGISGGSVTTPTGASNVELRGAITLTDELTLLWGSDDWLVSGSKAGNLRIQSASRVTVRNSEFGPYVNQVATINNAGGGPGPKDILIEASYFHDYWISDAAKHAECMQIWPIGASNIVLRNVVMANCTDFGVLVKASTTTGVVFDNVRIDKPMPGNTATAPGAPGTCYPNCPRGGSSIRFSTYAYQASAVKDSCLRGSLAIDVPGNVAVTNTTSNDPACSLAPPIVTTPPTTTTAEEPPPVTTTEATTTVETTPSLPPLTVVPARIYFELAWSGLSGDKVSIYRNGLKVVSATANDGTALTGAPTGKPYTYWLRDSSGTDTAKVTVQG